MAPLNVPQATIAGATLLNTVNYAGMFFGMTDDETRLLDAIQMRGRNGGRRETNSIEFILANTYKHRDPRQPKMTERQSMGAMPARTTPRVQNSNVIQMFRDDVEISFIRQSNFTALSGVNIANATNERPNELDEQIGHTLIETRRDLNYTIFNGEYSYTANDPDAYLGTRGLNEAIETNRYDFTGVALDDNAIGSVIERSISNGFNIEGVEIWCSARMQRLLTRIYSLLPGTTQPTTRTEGGLAYNQILTSFGTLPIYWEPLIPEDKIMFLNTGEVAVAEMPYINRQGENLGSLFFYDVSKQGAADGGFVYGQMGLDYGAEHRHVMIDKIDISGVA